MTRQKILAAATDEFAAHGFAGSRTARIAHRAGINRAMLYYYFGSKHALFEQVLARVISDIFREANWNGDDPVSSLIACVGVIMRDPRRIRLIQWESLQGPAVGTRLPPTGLDHFDSLAAIFKSDALQRHKAWMLVCAALTTFAFPHLAESAVGKSVQDVQFGVTHRRLVQQLADCLRHSR